MSSPSQTQTQIKSPFLVEKVDPKSVFFDLWIRRRAQYSTVAFVKSSDPKRLLQFIDFIDQVYSQSPKKLPYRIFLYKVWSGLYEVRIRRNGGVHFEYIPVSATASGSPLAQMIAGTAHIRDLGSALTYLDNVMQTSIDRTRIIAVFWGLFSYKSISDQELYALVKFLRNAIFTDEYYRAYHFIVVFTENPELIADDDTLKHAIVVDIPPSTKEEREKIIELIAKEYDVNINGELLEALAEATKGLNLHEVESVALESLFRSGTLDLAMMVQYKYDIVRKAGILDIEEPSHGFEAVGGYQVIKDFIMQNVVKVLRNPKRAEALGLRPPRGILLFGPPGTGKTWFARALAKELGIPFLRLRTERIVSMWYGETSRNLAKALQIAESVAPAVLFIDEIDRFGKRGGMTEHEESRRAFSILLEWLGDARRKTIVVGTTNRPEDLDEAFRRVGRFDYIIPMLYPDYEARLEILKIHTSVVRKVPLAKDVDLEEIAMRTELWSGAELEELVLRAARRALREDADVVRMKHFEEAIQTFRINEEERRKQLEHYLRLAQEFTNDAEFLDQLVKSYSASRLEALKQF